MAHQANDNVIETVVQLLCENGLPYMADILRLLNEGALASARSSSLTTHIKTQGLR